jgi:uncharacterized protein (DUF2141 family)
VRNGRAVLWFRDVPEGTYAVNVFHDENSNERLDKGLFGIPKEGFGFSNDAGRSKKALSFNEAKFDLPPTGCRTVRIVLKYEHGEVTDQCLYRGNIMVRG